MKVSWQWGYTFKPRERKRRRKKKNAPFFGQSNKLCLISIKRKAKVWAEILLSYLYVKVAPSSLFMSQNVKISV